MEKLKLPTYGGQAVIEGVMMRGKQSLAIAMRAPDNSIVIHKDSLGNLYRSRIAQIPFLRGMILLWDALGLGMKALTISANVQTDEDEKIEGLALVVTLIVSLAFAVGLFFLLPASLGHLSERIINSLLFSSLSDSSVAAWIGNLIEGLIRLLILVGYIWFIGRIPDIKRVFAYHGAEHKTINAFESGAELTPQIVKGYSLEHPRCGTAFLLTVVLLSVLFFSLLGPIPLGLRLASRIIMIPILTGVAYEYIRWTANHIESPMVKWMVKPNLALQHLTTREPDLEMLEVSIAAFNAMRSEEEGIYL
ncbi:MAG: DUF1385 domain-containing protein [Chloroflexota bacterium]|nr:MAG: DUF1385 domain-containing protein [Chloroflexota bacterium]